MKAVLINGSPKVKDSSSGIVLNEIKKLLEKRMNIEELSMRKPLIGKQDFDALNNCDVLIFSFPLYVDGIPSQLLSCLIQLENFYTQNQNKKIIVYAVVNCGFYEGKQADTAIDILKNFCIKAGLLWGQAVGLGGGGMLAMLPKYPLGKGPLMDFGNILIKLADTIYECRAEDTIYCEPNFPRFLYKLAAEIGWRRGLKANGLKSRDLKRRA